MKGQQKAIAVLGDFVIRTESAVVSITTIADTKDVRIDLIPFSRKDLRYMVRKPISSESCCFNLEKTQKAQ